MAITQRRSSMRFVLQSKRFAPASTLATGRRLLISAFAAGTLCLLAAGCDGGHDDNDARSSAAGATAMLPGTRDALAPQPGAAAQRFDTEGGTPVRAASDAPLSPVVHAAD